MPKRKAYIAALDHYPNPANNLPSCINDAKAFQVAIAALGFQDIKSDYDDKATLANVQAGLSWLFDGASADDRLVFFFSGHGYQAAKGDNLEEVLCLYDEFLFDDVLSQKTQALPPGVFTLVSDSCHSGGMYKMIFADGQTEVAQTKVLKVPPLAYQNKIFTDQAKATQLRYRSFGAKPMSLSAQGKVFGEGGLKGLDEAGQLQMNGLLLSACLADETASASTAKTNGKSAFTFALIEQMNALGLPVTNQRLIDGTISMLRTLGFRQTPVLMEPTRPAGLGGKSFLTFEGQSAGGNGTDNWIMSIIHNALGNARKEYVMASSKSSSAASSSDEKGWGLIASLASVALPALVRAIRKGGYEQQKEFSSIPGGQEKFWGTIFNVLTTAVPAVVQALRKGGYEPQKDFDGANEKSLDSIIRIATSCIPPICRAMLVQGIQPQKDFGGEQKFWGAIANALSAALPAVIGALSKQGVTAKGFEDVPAGDQKFFGAIASIVGTLGPLVIQALSKSGVEQKDFEASGAEGQEKFLGAILSVVSAVAPVVIQALTKSGAEPAKEFGGEEKFWGAFASVIQSALPAVISAFSKGDFDDKGFKAPAAPEPVGEEKFWGTIARVVASAIPTIVGELTKGAGEDGGPGKGYASSDVMESYPPMPPGLVDKIVASTLHH
jgi:hypothetical protein